ncbi:hypothetical protein POM88_017933 [Heracleum sosnowskyi]|uniref:RRM domain-containing protein n=1 Tax=Heracleum sosnowskyi TaxID=360622 RepID=A0AAD8ITF8_9APIA|nr:hypothetical protein POM88_017933 [Heracleum sosnowskyi]
MVVNKKSRTFKKSREPGCTIFVSKIPGETTAKDIWHFFKQGGEIKDIVLPRKRDKYNNRIGFVKTSSELEVGKIISNLKQLNGLGRILRMSINKYKTGLDDQKKEKVFIPKDSSTEKHFEHPEVGKVEASSKKHFAYTEAEVNDAIEEGMKDSLIGFTKETISAKDILSDLKDFSNEDTRVLQINKGVFLLGKLEGKSW